MTQGYCDFCCTEHSKGEACAIYRPEKLPGKKLDQEKPRYELIPFQELDEVVEVLTFGAKKYEAENWKKVKDGEKRYFAAALRHLSAVGQGIQKDSETNFSHYSHAICSLFFALWHNKHASKEDKK